jgi:hypothetical protein
MGPSETENNDTETRRLRRACNLCHQMKLRCTGTNPCARCQDTGCECIYGLAAKLGKPKGVRNKKTLQRLQNKDAMSTETSPEKGGVAPPPNSRASPSQSEIDNNRTIMGWSTMFGDPSTVPGTPFQFDDLSNDLSMADMDIERGWEVYYQHRESTIRTLC